MLPPVHPGIAYLVYAGAVGARGRSPPDDLATLALVVGALLPDLLDQPLYYAADVPSTRTLGHSLLFLVPLCLLVGAVASRSSGAGVGIAFAVGALSHPVADAVWPLAFGAHAELGFLLWPVTPSPDYEGVKTLAVVGDVVVTTAWVELPLLAVALGLWWRHGAPGPGAVRSWVGQRVRE